MNGRSSIAFQNSSWLDTGRLIQGVSLVVEPGVGQTAQPFPHEGEVMSRAQMALSGLHQEGIEARQMPLHARAKHAHHRLVTMLQSLECPPIAVPGPPQSTVLLLDECQQAGQIE